MSSKFMFFLADGSACQANSLTEVYDAHREDARKWRERAMQAENDLIAAREERNRAITRTTKDEEKIVKLLPVLGGAKAVLHDIELFWHGRPDYIGANTGTLAHFIKEAEAVL